jgi:hypothetical protein
MISGKELSFYFRSEYNRAFYYAQDIQATADIELNGRCAIRGGLALGSTGNEFDIKAFAGGEAALPFVIPLSLGLAWRYDGSPRYETHSHALLPLVSLKGRWAGISLGTNFRLTSFFNEPPIFETMLSFSAYVNFFMNRILRLGLRCANFSDFAAGNMGAYFFSLDSSLRLNERISLVNEINVLQSGSVALTAALYGIAWRGGVSFSW